MVCPSPTWRHILTELTDILILGEDPPAAEEADVSKIDDLEPAKEPEPEPAPDPEPETEKEGEEGPESQSPVTYLCCTCD